MAEQNFKNPEQNLKKLAERNFEKLERNFRNLRTKIWNEILEVAEPNFETKCVNKTYISKPYQNMILFQTGEDGQNDILRTKCCKNYKAKLNKEIAELDKLEEDCQKELKQIKEQRKKLIDQVDDANKQAEKILKEAVGKK